MKLTDLESFVAVIDHGTITAAAAAAGVPKSTISRRVTRLEQDLGVSLIVRSSRSFALTDEGRRLHSRARPALRELLDVSAAVRDGADEPRGKLVLTTAYDLASSWFLADVLKSFCAQYPRVELEVRLESRFIDLVAEDVDVALRAHGAQIPGDPTLMARTVGDTVVALFASRSYLARAGHPEHPRELSEHALVAHVAATKGPRAMISSAGEEALVDFSSATIKANDYGMIHSLVRAGMGVGLLPLDKVRYEQEPRIERVLPRWRRRLGKLSLVWPRARFTAPSVRAFIDFASARFAAHMSGEP